MATGLIFFDRIYKINKMFLLILTKLKEERVARMERFGSYHNFNEVKKDL